jgi:hypothetical protein
VKLDKMITNRDDSPLMGDLYELGLKHDVIMVVLAIPRTGPEIPCTVLTIDLKDDTKSNEAADMIESAGVYLIKASEELRRNEGPVMVP